MTTKKGQISTGSIPNFVWVLMLIGIYVGLGLILLAKFRDQSSSADANTSIDDVITAIGEIPGWLSLLIVVVFIAIVIGLIAVVRAIKGRD